MIQGQTADCVAFVELREHCWLLMWLDARARLGMLMLVSLGSALLVAVGSAVRDWHHFCLLGSYLQQWLLLQSCFDLVEVITRT